MVLALSALALGVAAAVATRPAPYAGPLRQSEQLRADKSERARYLQDVMKYGADNVETWSERCCWVEPAYRHDSMFGMK